MDTNNAAATAVATTYTVAPTGGTIVAVVDRQNTFFGSTTTIGEKLEWTYSALSDQPVTLRGTSDYFGCAAGAALTATVFVEWTEE